MHPSESGKMERLHFIANEMNVAFDHAQETEQTGENRDNLMELAGTLAGIAILSPNYNLSEEERQKLIAEAGIKYIDGQDPSSTNLEAINSYIESNFSEEDRHYAKYDIDFEDEMDEEYRGKILNKVYWHVKLQEEVDKARRNDTDLSLIFIDFNFIKQINDIYGHPEGDKVLRDMKILFAKVSTEFRLTQDETREPRPSDLISYGKNFNGNSSKEDNALHTGRLGGDEFGSICYTDMEGAGVIAARIRKLVSEYVNSEGKEHLRELGLDAAIGVATLEDGMTSSDLLELADTRMYEDKRIQKEARKTRFTAEQMELIRQLEDTGVSLEEIGKYRQHAAPGSEHPSLF